MLNGVDDQAWSRFDEDGEIVSIAGIAAPVGVDSKCVTGPSQSGRPRLSSPGQGLPKSTPCQRSAQRGIADLKDCQPPRVSLGTPIGADLDPRPRTGLWYLFGTTKKKGTQCLHQVPDFRTEFGRREWTRTIDPHHVKVVL